ncbi:MAG: beta-propeller domain-containing protein [Nanoarchaeota archaeon]|nr:beta-propeller domain-containing protein [Nanoarchaeota archaeon]
MKHEILTLFVILLITSLVLNSCDIDDLDITRPSNSNIKRFQSESQLLDAFEEYRTDYGRGIFGGLEMMTGAKDTAQAIPESGGSNEYSETNVQVEGVDEADIVKTDGKYVYMINRQKLIILDAYPANQAEILSETEFDEFSPSELFIHEDKLLVFGYHYQYFEYEPMVGGVVRSSIVMPNPYSSSFMSVKLFDISDKEDPELIKTVDFEGNYITSRKIDEYVYFVVNSYPNWDGSPTPLCEEFVPAYRDDSKTNDFEPVADCVDIGYVEPLQATNFITLASISMEDEEIEKEVIVGSGQNVYASLDNMYIAQTSYPRYIAGKLASDFTEETIISKFSLDDGEIKFENTGEVKGHILNQFSMDEFEDHFRIATTIGQVSRMNSMSTNNVYVLDGDMEVVGELEDLAPGEKIYSVRFMGEKGYVVTFKKVDPLFVIDLSDPDDPEVLGKLKIPGYSDYLHPYDSDHIIGIGKNTIESEEGDFAWYQGVKMAIFDVSDVENPIELHKIEIGDRGTSSPVLSNHKAFLFDRDKDLLVIPILLAELDEDQDHEDWQQGNYVYQGAYVYDITLEDGFDLRGRITHYEDEDAFVKSGYYFRGDYSVERSLFINDVLYTLSNKMIKMNDLDDLDELNSLEF